MSKTIDKNVITKIEANLETLLEEIDKEETNCRFLYITLYNQFKEYEEKVQCERDWILEVLQPDTEFNEKKREKLDRLHKEQGAIVKQKELTRQDLENKTFELRKLFFDFCKENEKLIKTLPSKEKEKEHRNNAQSKLTTSSLHSSHSLSPSELQKILFSPNEMQSITITSVVLPKKNHHPVEFYTTGTGSGVKTTVKLIYTSKYKAAADIAQEHSKILDLKLSDPHILNVISVYKPDKEQFIKVIMEPVRFNSEYNRTLYDFLRKEEVIAFHDKIHIMAQLENGLAYLQKQGISVKRFGFTSVFITDGYNIKIADYGLSRLQTIDYEKLTSRDRIFLLTSAPELFGESGLDDATASKLSEIYTLGMIYLFLIKEKFPKEVRSWNYQKFKTYAHQSKQPDILEIVKKPPLPDSRKTPKVIDKLTLSDVISQAIITPNKPFGPISWETVAMNSLITLNDEGVKKIWTLDPSIPRLPSDGPIKELEWDTFIGNFTRFVPSSKDYHPKIGEILKLVLNVGPDNKVLLATFERTLNAFPCNNINEWIALVSQITNKPWFYGWKPREAVNMALLDYVKHSKNLKTRAAILRISGNSPEPLVISYYDGKGQNIKDIKHCLIEIPELKGIGLEESMNKTLKANNLKLIGVESSARPFYHFYKDKKENISTIQRKEKGDKNKTGDFTTSTTSIIT